MNLEHKKQEMKQDNEKTKKTFFKSWWFIVIVVIVVTAIIGEGFSNKEVSKKLQNIEWSSLELNEFLPKPEKQYGEIATNRSDLAIISISKLTEKDYKVYVQKCIDNGYSIDLEYDPWDTVYGAFNKEGYSIRIIYSEIEEKMHITLAIPEKLKMKENEWPTKGLGAMLSSPKSNLGYISWDNKYTFSITIGNMTISDYNEYVKNCENKGFIVDYSKSDKIFSAKNSEGYKLNLRYLGANVIEIYMENDKEKNSNNTEETNKDENQPDNVPKQTEDEKSNIPNTSESVSYSTNDETTVKNGNTGVYSYKKKGGQYDNYVIIDFDNGYVYFFSEGSEGNGSEICEKYKIASGDLNSTLIINDDFCKGLFFKYKNLPNHLMLEDNDHFNYDFYTTNLNDALKIRDKKEIKNY